MNIIQHLIFLCFIANSTQIDSNTLDLVFVLFRHGARTPEISDTYPNDPYKADAFLPMGHGQLTKLGKRQEYQLGKMLRGRYNSFLGATFYPDMVLARSTDYSRTKMSAQLVLAGLFPPSQSDIWNDDLLWQPIPVSYEKTKKDTLLERALHFCPKYIQEYNTALTSERTQNFLQKHKDAMAYMTNHTGRQISTINEGFSLYQNMLAEENMNLTLPEWTRKVYPGVLSEFALERCLMENASPLMKKLQGGRIWQHILKTMISKSENNLQPVERKIILFSGHDFLVYNVLAALDLVAPKFPEYSAAVIVELHRLGSKKFAVKILFSGARDKEIEVLTLKGCEEECPLNEFINLTESLIPGNYTGDCESEVDLDLGL